MIRPYSEYDELYHKYFEDENCFIIETPYELYPLYHIGGEEEEGYDVSAILSSNYQDLYLIFTGAFEFTLPHKVDAKYEWNCNINDNNIISKYKLTLNRNRPDTTSIEFIKRSIENLEDDYIVLTTEFDLNYYTHRTDNYSFEELNDREVVQSFARREYNPDIAHRKNLSIYFAFPVPDFMNEWNQVELKSNKDYPLDKRSFSYPWQEYKYQFPCVLTVYRRNQRDSPILGSKMNPNLRSINEPSAREVSSNTQKRTKTLTIDPSLRPSLEVAPPIDFQEHDFFSPTGNLPENDSQSELGYANSPAEQEPQAIGGAKFPSEMLGSLKEPKETKKPIFKNNSLYPKNLTSTKKKP